MTAAVNVSSEWSTGYCANLSITNNNSAGAESWTAVINMNGGRIYTSWNGNFSGTSGSITVSAAVWNAAVAAGQTVEVAGFCAERYNGATATVVSAAGTY